MSSTDTLNYLIVTSGYDDLWPAPLLILENIENLVTIDAAVFRWLEGGTTLIPFDGQAIAVSAAAEGVTVER